MPIGDYDTCTITVRYIYYLENRYTVKGETFGDERATKKDLIDP